MIGDVGGVGVGGTGGVGVGGTGGTGVFVDMHTGGPKGSPDADHVHPVEPISILCKQLT